MHLISVLLFALCHCRRFSILPSHSFVCPRRRSSIRLRAFCDCLCCPGLYLLSLSSFLFLFSILVVYLCPFTDGLRFMVRFSAGVAVAN